MYDPIAISKYGQERQREILRDAEAYWKAQAIRKERGQNSQINPAGRNRLQRAAHLLMTLIAR